MNIPNNKGIDIRPFKYQLTYWLKLDKLRPVTNQIRRHNGRKCYGKSFIIKRKSIYDNKYAVFTKGVTLPNAKEEIKGITVKTIMRHIREESMDHVSLYKRFKKRFFM